MNELEKQSKINFYKHREEWNSWYIQHRRIALEKIGLSSSFSTKEWDNLPINIQSKFNDLKTCLIELKII